MHVAVTSKVIHREGNARFRCAAVSMNGYRNSMEDSHAMHCLDNLGLFGVFDGHAGSACSAFVAHHLPTAVLEHLGSSGSPSAIADKDLAQIFLDTDTKFLTENPTDSSGSTGTVLLAWPPKADHPDTSLLQIANVGDSRVLVVLNGKLAYSTTDHNPANPKEAARLRSVGATIQNSAVVSHDNTSALAVSRAFGDRDYKHAKVQTKHHVIAKPDIEHYRLKHVGKGPTYALLCCDGIFEGLSNEQVVAYVNAQLKAHPDDPARVMRGLCDHALAAGSTDNMTAMLVEFRDGSGHSHGGAPAADLIPGPFLPLSSTFIAAYRVMAEKANLSLGQAMALRYQAVTEAAKAGHGKKDARKKKGTKRDRAGAGIAEGADDDDQFPDLEVFAQVQPKGADLSAFFEEHATNMEKEVLEEERKEIEKVLAILPRKARLQLQKLPHAQLLEFVQEELAGDSDDDDDEDDDDHDDDEDEEADSPPPPTVAPKKQKKRQKTSSSGGAGSPPQAPQAGKAKGAKGGKKAGRKGAGK